MKNAPPNGAHFLIDGIRIVSPPLNYLSSFFSYVRQFFNRPVRTLDYGIFKLTRKARAKAQSEFVAEFYLLSLFLLRQPFGFFLVSKLVYSSCEFVLHKTISLLPSGRMTYYITFRKIIQPHLTQYIPQKDMRRISEGLCFPPYRKRYRRQASREKTA